MITELPPLEIEGHEPSVPQGHEHPMRVMTRRVAGLAEGGWTDEDRERTAAYFDGLAGEWHSRVTGPRNAVVDDALARGLDGAPGGLAVEVGSGIGTYSERLARRWDQVVAVELSMEMLRNAPATPAGRVRADAARLPFADGAAAAVVLVNMMLFPAEVDRVLADDGAVVWVNSSGEHTPIHLPAAEVAEVLPGEWTGVASRAGIGLWCVLRRRVASPAA